MSTWAEATKDIKIHPSLIGAKEQAAAAPAAAGATEREPAEPANESETNSAGGAAAEVAGELNNSPKAAPAAAGADSEKTPQSKEEQRQQAERRRETETQARIDAALADERRKNAAELARAKDKFIADMQIVNPATGKLVSTQAEFEAFQHAMNEQRINAGLGRMGLERDVIDAMIDEHPDVRKARELVSEAQTEKKRVLDGAAETRLKSELEAIQKYEPMVKTADDLLALPSYADIHRLVGAGLSISEAYFNVNRETILDKERKAAAQDAYNNIAGKQHMTGDVTHGSGGATIPADVKKQMRNAYPSLSEAELQKKYERVVAQQKKG